MIVPYTQYSTVGAGSTITSTDERNDLIIIHENAGLIATLTLNLPANPVNNQRVTFATVNGVTALTMAIGTIVGAITTLVAGGKFTFIYNTGSGAGKWYQIS